MDANRKTAFYVLRDTEEKKSYSNIAINKYIEKVEPDSTAFVRELVYGTLKNRIKIDYILQRLLKDPLEKTDVNSRTILRMGIYQIMGMHSVPEYAAVDECVKLAKKFARGRDSFINGVLRAYTREKDNIIFPEKKDDFTEYASIEYSFLPWIIELWIKQFGEEGTEELLKACNETPRLTLRTNTLKGTREQLMEKLDQRDVNTYPSEMSKETLHVEGGRIIKADLYKKGFYSIQDDSSYMAVNVLDPKPGDVIIDTCAAPGGKSLAIAEKMGNKGRVISFDIYIRKLREITENAKRLGVDIIETKPWDSRRTDSSLIGKADRVIVDAPCSALGLVRRKPEIKYKQWDHTLAVDLPKTQLDILKGASSYLKAGGTMVYCTCTINRLENEDVVKKFLQVHPEFTKEQDMILLPNVNHTNGFYICKLKKTSNIAKGVT